MLADVVAMNFQPIIDNIHLILPGIALIIFAFTQLAAYKAKKNPDIDWWDSAADRSKWVLEQYQWGLEQLVKVGSGKWSGAEKLAESTARAKRFEDLWSQGKIVEAMAEVTGFRQSVMSKLEKAGASQFPFGQSQNQAIAPASPPDVIPGAESANLPSSGIGNGVGSGVVGSQLGPALDKVRAAVRK